MTDNIETTTPPENTSATDYLEALKGDIEGVKEDVKSKSEKIDRSAKMAERLERVFKDETDDSNLSDDEKDARWLKQFKEAADADKKAGGSGLPLTTRLAEENAQLKKMVREVQEQLKALGNKHETSQSPEFKYDQAAFEKIDMQVQDAINSIYGEIDQHLFEAVSKDIVKEVKRLKEQAPKTWEEIRRSPEMIRRMSLHFVEKKIPPRAREMMHAEKEQNTQMTDKELRQAFKEADSIKDIKARGELRASIRQRMLESSFGKK